MDSSPRFVFFLRHYNDIDHITPIIHKLAKKNESNQIDVCLMDDYQYKHITDYTFKDDFRIEHIKNLPNCQVYFLHDLIFNTAERMAKSAKEDIAITHVKKWGRKLPTQWPKKIWDSITDITPEDDENWENVAEKTYQELLLNKTKTVVAFDWIMSPGGRGDFVNYIIETANAEGHKTVSLPHGDAPFVNHWTKLDDYIDHDDFENSNFGIKGLIYDSKIQIEYDDIVVPNYLVKSRRSHYDDGRLRVLGSPRFNKEWVQTLTELSPRFEPTVDGAQHRIVIFSRKPSLTVDQKALAEAIRIIAKFSNLSVVVKHHTRNPNDELHEELQSQTGGQIYKKENLQIVYDDVHSVSLLNWGDIFLDAGTSVIFEAIVRNKPVLALEYTHWNESTIAHHLPESAVLRSRDDLYEYMHRINQLDQLSDEINTYDENDQKLFVNEIVTHKNNDVLSEYAEFLMNL